MTGAEMKAIREAAGLSVNQLADFLYTAERGVVSLREMERGKRDITGPVQRVLEIISEGRVDDLL